MLISKLKFIQDFLNDNLGVVTFIVGFLAIYLYIKQRKDKKRDSASLILQEIRYAEQQIRKYRAFGKYKLSDRLLPTNSWNENIHLFINDLKETELDLISSFYSKAAYLDIVIEKISDQKNTTMMVAQSSSFNSQESITPQQPQQSLQPVEIEIMGLMPLSQKILSDVSQSVEFIYNTPVVEKLREISEKKWYQLF